MEEKREIATRDSWRNLKPFPKWKRRIYLNRTFTEEEFKKIALGLIPNSMDDHWFAFLENDTLYIHRSWSGNCIYKIDFACNKHLYIPKEVRLNRLGWGHIFFSFATKRFHKKILLFLIENELLEQNKPFPIPKLLKRILEHIYKEKIEFL